MLLYSVDLSVFNPYAAMGIKANLHYFGEGYRDQYKSFRYFLRGRAVNRGKYLEGGRREDLIIIYIFFINLP